MRYYVSDLILSTILLLLTIISINLSQLPVFRFITISTIYTMIFQFAVVKHRALPRLSIIFCFLLDDASQAINLGASSLSIMVAIESTRLLLSHLRIIANNKMICSIIFSIFYIIYSTCRTALICIYNSMNFSIITLIAEIVLSTCIYTILFHFAVSTYDSLYQYYKPARA